MTKARLIRTNEKPEASLLRAADLPEYDVVVAGEVVGKVYAALSRETRHYSSGSRRVWRYRLRGRSSTSYVSKNDARDALLRELGIEA
jgi:hypothetical protein